MKNAFTVSHSAGEQYSPAESHTTATTTALNSVCLKLTMQRQVLPTFLFSLCVLIQLNGVAYHRLNNDSRWKH